LTACWVLEWFKSLAGKKGEEKEKEKEEEKKKCVAKSPPQVRIPESRKQGR
jgi:hypothetical protein